MKGFTGPREIPAAGGADESARILTDPATPGFSRVKSRQIGRKPTVPRSHPCADGAMPAIASQHAELRGLRSTLPIDVLLHRC